MSAERTLSLDTAAGQRVHVAEAFNAQTLLVVEGSDDTRAACLLDPATARQLAAFLDRTP